MARFIPKHTLTEGMAANPLDHQVSEEQDVTKLAQEGILTAVAAETDAINQYTQIGDLIFSSEQWLKDLAEPVINDIIAEEKKHLGQLTELLSQLPGYQKDFEEGEKETQTGEDTSEEKESVKESLAEAVLDYYKRDPKTGRLIDPETGTIAVEGPIGFFQNNKFVPMFTLDSENRLHSIDKNKHKSNDKVKEDKEEEKEEVEECGPTFDLASTLKIITEEYPTASSFWSTDEISNTKESVRAEYIDSLLEAVEMDAETLDKIEKRIISEAIINK